MQKKTIFFEMALRKNGIRLTVNGVWAPLTFYSNEADSAGSPGALRA